MIPGLMPLMEADDVVMLELGGHVHLVHDSVASVLFRAFDGHIGDGVSLAPLVNNRVLAVAYLVI
eukprot:4947955-Amphidinium_carterae.1